MADKAQSGIAEIFGRLSEQQFAKLVSIVTAEKKRRRTDAGPSFGSMTDAELEAALRKALAGKKITEDVVSR